MSGPREARIQDLMQRFRMAAGDPVIRGRHAGFHSFPSGSCTWASFAFGHILAELEPDADWHLVNAEALDGWGGHDWLESHGLAVDVTADQFSGYVPYIGSSPAPRPVRYGKTKRVELADWTPAMAAALEDIADLMLPGK